MLSGTGAVSDCDGQAGARRPAEHERRCGGDAGAGEQIPDAIIDAKVNVRAIGASPNVCVMNPTDAAALLKTKSPGRRVPRVPVPGDCSAG